MPDPAGVSFRMAGPDDARAIAGSVLSALTCCRLAGTQRG
jgi:hypothetical protein